MIILQDKLEEKYQEDVWRLLYDADEEFIPPLSAREKTTQTNLGSGTGKKGGPKQYFEQMKTQAFVLYVRDEKVVGFLTYIPNHVIEVQDARIICEYISTIVVAPDCRNKGITGKMYQALMENCTDKNIATRTWSTNHAHIHLLEKLSFEQVLCIKDDRGKGIDTVYYMKKWE
ncbi:MAG: GNAT family N-acetyltransferase [Acetatifactor sp.]|nr:GNAT family N-acetyltransferase [Acetatifactor sp.]